MSYYIKGNKERGAEVIKALVDKGGNNTRYSVSGTDEAGVYYIDKLKDIRFQCGPRRIEVIKEVCEELTLPEKWIPKFKVGDEVTHSVCGGHGVIKGIVDTDNCPHCYIVKDDDDKEFLHPWYESETELYKWTPQRGETILVRWNVTHFWKEAIFSFYDEAGEGYYVVGGNCYPECIPFDLNKLGKVTED